MGALISIIVSLGKVVTHATPARNRPPLGDSSTCQVELLHHQMVKTCCQQAPLLGSWQPSFLRGLDIVCTSWPLMSTGQYA